MKRKTKLILGVFALGVTAIGLTSCTASFCSVNDKSSVMYAFDVYNLNDDNSGRYSFGVSTYYDTQVEGSVPLQGYDQLYVSHNIDSNLALKQINANAIEQNIRVNDFTDFWALMDLKFLNMAVEAAKDSKNSAYHTDKTTMTYNDIVLILIGDKEGNNRGYGYTKYAGTNDNNNYWVNWNETYQQVKKELGVDYCPDADYVKYYQSSMSNYASTANSCLATTNGFYGYYGFNNENKLEVFIEAKNWEYAWGRGFFEGLLVYPIGWLIDATANSIIGTVGGGWAQVLAILIVTFLIRAIMMIFTLNQTRSTAKMSELSPEIAKIQAKYPNANSNRNEQQQLAMETQALYKKNKIHPFLSILVLIIQFPIFICVWGAMTGSAILASNEFLGLRLSDSVQSQLFNLTNWPNQGGWWTALILFLVMAGLQALAMLLPQIIQKRKQKAIAKTTKNPNMKKQGDKMKWFTIIMLVMIIFMGFSLASGMVIYWIAGSVWTIGQTMIIELITYLKKKNKNKKPRGPRGKNVQTADSNIIVDAEVIPEHIAAPTGKKKYKDKGNS